MEVATAAYTQQQNLLSLLPLLVLHEKENAFHRMCAYFELLIKKKKGLFACPFKEMFNIERSLENSVPIHGTVSVEIKFHLKCPCNLNTVEFLRFLSIH